MINYSASYTDQYQITMAQVYFSSGQSRQPVVFDYFFRRLPQDSGYAIFAGLEVLLETLENLRFTEDDLSFLSKLHFEKHFLKYLEEFRFTGNIYAIQEGNLIFPNSPILRVEGPLIEVQLVETIILNILNFQSLIATKASRIRQAAGNRCLLDFGLRRSHGPAGFYASRAAIIGGFDGTSNVRAAREMNIRPSGTMAHSFIQSYPDELTAFRDFSQQWPDNCVLLVDTYNTLQSGIPNAIKIGLEMQKRGQKLKGIRLDSGDLAYLSKKCRIMLDEAGLYDVNIAASNQLNEHIIKSLLEQEAPIDVFGVGTDLVVGRPDAVFDGVFKMASINDTPKIKISENIQKITLPHRKQIHRVIDSHGQLVGADLISLDSETSFTEMIHPYEPLKKFNVQNLHLRPLLSKVMEKGHRCLESQPVQAISAFRTKELSQLPEEYQRFNNPHIYKVGLSEILLKERNSLIEKYRIKT